LDQRLVQGSPTDATSPRSLDGAASWHSWKHKGAAHACHANRE